MVGEGVLFECLQNKEVSKVLSISRKTNDVQHVKLEELLVPDFTKLDEYSDKIKGYDACFYCAGISSVGMKEDKYTFITYDTTIDFAKALLKANPNISFCYISGGGTDSSEQGKTMWARVKGKTENALNDLPFKKEYNFRPGLMLPFSNHKNAKTYYVWLGKLVNFFLPSQVIKLDELGRAMINALKSNDAPNILEIKDIKALAIK